ncbi:MAG: thymidine kinase [Chloroflexi bacterium]|nr:MAG: thymidine kinase [Phototrophicales bacterium]RMF76673.1 MAG: thymidine kinase [Chloroflexota bacterium]
MVHRSGRIEVICGSMFSGKTEELIRRIRRATIAKQNVQVFKPGIDVRYSLENVSSHNGQKIEAEPIENANDILDKVKDDTTVVAIDEIQFFDNEILNVIEELAARNIRVIAAGLDMDFRAEPFGAMPQLLCRAEEVMKLHAICVVCGEDASRTQRLVNGKPAHYNDPIILVGAQETYEARCRKHHVVEMG